MTTSKTTHLEQENQLQDRLKNIIDLKTKPIGALGRLEDIALQIGTVQNSLAPQLTNPSIIVFAADHGIAKEGVSAYSQDVTHQMVINFLNNGAGINVFSRQHGISLYIVDAGVNYDFPENKNLIISKIAKGTKNFLNEPAMSQEQLDQCFEEGRKSVQQLNQCNILGFGEMGIGNTSSASIIMSILCNMDIEKCIGRGTGLTDIQLENKIDILKKAILKHDNINSPQKVLMTFGGFEIAQMCAAMLEAYKKNMLIMIDGFVASSAFLAAYKIKPDIKKNAIFCHLSDESAHIDLLNYFNVKPILSLNMRLGEGTGCALAYPIIESAVKFLIEMSSFESAGITNKN